MLVKINLLPEEMRRDKSRSWWPEIRGLHLVVLLLLFFVISPMVVQLVVVSRRQTLANLNRKWETVRPQMEEMDRMKKNVLELGAKVKALEGLSIGGFHWAEKMSDLSDSVTSGIWLTGLYVTKRTVPKVEKTETPASEKGKAGEKKEVVLRFLELEGCTLAQGEAGTAAVGRFIRSLESNPRFFKDFSSIESKWIKRETVNQVEVMSFKLSCRFKGELN